MPLQTKMTILIIVIIINVMLIIINIIIIIIKIHVRIIFYYSTHNYMYTLRTTLTCTPLLNFIIVIG